MEEIIFTQMTKLIIETKNLPMCLRLTIYKYHFLVSNFLYISIITLPIDQLSKLFCPERKKKIPRKKFIQEISPGTCSLYEKCWNNPYKAIVFYMKEKLFMVHIQCIYSTLKNITSVSSLLFFGLMQL